MHEQCDSVLLDLNVSSNIVQYKSLTRYILYIVRIYLLDKHILILEKPQGITLMHSPGADNDGH